MASLQDLQKKASQGLTKPTGLEAAQGVAAGMGVQPASVQPALQQLTSVATTGKAAAPSVGAGEGPQASNIQERLAQAQVAGAQKQLFGEAAAADKEQALKEQEAYLQLSDQAFQIREQAIETKTKLQQQFDTLLTDLEGRRSGMKIEDEGDRLEQMYQLARLGNDKYINKLQLEGARARLDNNVKFKEEMMRSIFEGNMDLLRDNFSFKNALLADDQKFKQELAKMDINSAIRLLEGDLQVGQEAALYTGLGNIMSGAAQGAAGYASQKVPTPKAPNALGESTDYGLGVDTSITSFSEPAPVAPTDWSTYKFGEG